MQKRKIRPETFQGEIKHKLSDYPTYRVQPPGEKSFDIRTKRGLSSINERWPNDSVKCLTNR